MTTPGADPWPEFWAKLRTHRRDVLGLLRGVGEDSSGHQPGGEWSVKQQVAHMCETEGAWLGRALAALGKPGARASWASGVGQPFIRDVEDANGYPLWYWVTRLRAGRGETLRLLAAASPTDTQLETRGQDPSAPAMTVIQMLRALYHHDRMHLDQMRGQPSSFDPAGRRGGS